MAHFDGTEKIQVNPSCRNEDVYTLDCTYCSQKVCDRGMKSFLIADEKMELYSTDRVDRCLVDLTDEKFRTDKCRCQIQNVACLKCGNVVGYHVSLPCHHCLHSQNNGHYWMFYRSAVIPYQRMNLNGTALLVWGDLSHYDLEESTCDSFWGECER